MRLEATGGFLEGTLTKRAWMDPWQCYLGSIAVFALGLTILLDSIRRVDPPIKANPSKR
jgi:hypothetical protein